MLQTKLRRSLAPVVLLAILAMAAGLRFINLNWDNGIFAHPDERSTVAFYAPTIRWPAEPDSLLDPRASTLNPFWDVQNQSRRSYTYGHFPLYALVLAAHGLKALAPLAADWGLPADWVSFLNTSTSGQGYALVGRALTALADLFTVYLVFLLGRRLYGLWAGLLAAALSALTVLQIQLAHFFAVDPISTTFTLLALYGAMLMYHRQSRGAAVLTGVGIGLAVASKFSALPVAFAPLAAGYLAVTRSRAAEDGTGQGVAGRMLALALVALVVSFVVFAITSPFVLLDFQNFRTAVLDEQGSMVSGVADLPFTRQYRNTPAYWYFIEQQLRWGMGWPLGLLALAGTVWVFGKAVTGRAQPGEWILLGWVVLYFGPTGLFLAKFMRYMVPVVPLFVLFGAGLVAALWRFGSRHAGEPDRPLWRSLARIAAGLAGLVALFGAAVWSLAFVNGVYGTEHPWVTFARWTYATVPDGACIAREHWDEGIPASIPEPRGNPYEHAYFQPELPMYEEDTWHKYENLRATLMGCDYIALASNRLWRTIPRLPERYPMSSRYYDALFSGELGFEQVFSVETPPRLGPLVFDDQAADESFTVYDHPRPIMFKKVQQLSEAEWDALLGWTWEGAIHGYVGKPTLLMRLRGYNNPPGYASGQAEAGDKTLLLDRPVDQLPVVDDFRWNSAANSSSPVAILFWWLVTVAIGLLAWPVTFWLFHRLTDRGYGLSKGLGLLLVSYFVWINSSLGWLGNRLSTALIAVMLLAGLALWAVVRFRQEMLAFWRQRARLVLVTEAVFGLVYLYFVYLRLLNPDLWQPWLGGEKMLEIGFLNAIVRSADMPPYDPFFAGGIINYYYYGLFIVGILIKLTGIEPAIAFNLAVPTLAALTAANAFSLAGNLAGARLRLAPRPRRGAAPPPASPGALMFSAAGLLAVLFVLFIGNLEGAAQFLRELGNASRISFQSAIPGLETLVRAVAGFGRALLTGESLATYNYWDPTRVIPATINEFPYFSFLFADLHPHMIGIPFTILLLSLAYNWLVGEQAAQPVRPDEPAIEAQSEGFEALAVDQPAGVQPDDQAALPLEEPAMEQPGKPGPGFERNYYAAFSSWQSVLNPSQLLRWLALPFVLGALAVINTWDLPTYLGLMVAAFVLSRYRQTRSLLSARQVVMLAVTGAAFAGLLLGLAYLLYLPFFASYQALDVGLGLVHTQTALDQHLKIWGLFLFIIVSWLSLSLLYPASRNSLLRATSLAMRRLNVAPHLAEIYRKLVKRQSDLYQLGGWSIGLVLLAAVALALLGYHVPAYLLPLAALALLLLARREIEPETSYLNLLAFTGLLVLLGVEFFFLRDFLGGGDHYRMNTLFKFFIQVWVLFSLVSALTLPRLWEWSQRWTWPGRYLWRAAAALLLMASLVYPVFATRTRVDDRFPGQNNRPPFGTLDGLAYMTVGEFEWPAGSPVELRYDYEAIRWLQENITGTPVIAEAKVGFYREGGMRVAAYTGLPSILGGLHQNEQRYASQISQREVLVNEFWATPDPARTLQLIRELNISYIYLGQIERITHGYYIEDKFEQLRAQGSLEVVFQNDKTTIYIVK